MNPLAIDLFCGLGGWTKGLQAEGYHVLGVDIERHVYGEARYPGSLWLQDARTIHGSQFRSAALIVASPPCQKFSYMAMPWSRAKAQAAAIRADESGRMLAELNELFDTCFRIQREACESAGHHIPMVVENVRGAIPWVGRSRWNFGSFHLWGDVPALMPPTAGRGVKVPGVGAGWVGPDDPRHKPGLAFNPGAQGAQVRADLAAAADGRKVPGFRFDGSGRSFQSASVEAHVSEGVKIGFTEKHSRDHAQAFGWPLPNTHSKSPRRKAASAAIAKIPLPLARWIGRAWYPSMEIADG